MALRYLPNVITCLRILLVFPIVSAINAQDYRLACILFILAGITDGLDGFLARRFNWGSRFGSVVDPIADKILLTACLFTLAFHQAIPLWLPIVIIIRDIWVATGAICYHFLISRYEMAPPWISKVNTFLQIFFLFLVLINLGISKINPLFIDSVMWFTLIACLISWFHYTYVWGKKAWREIHKLRRENHE